MLGLVARLRRHRRPAVIIAAGLIAVQALLSGLALAQAAVMPAPDFGDAAGFGVICHGNGGAISDTGTAPGPAKNWRCCFTCAASAPPAALPTQPIGLRSPVRRSFKSPFFGAVSILSAPRAVRAGRSRAPPTLD